MKNFLIRCDVSDEIGYGHIVRCVTIAKKIATTGLNTVFIVTGDALGKSYINETGLSYHFQYNGFKTAQEEVNWLGSFFIKYEPVGVLFDLRNGVSLQQLESIKTREIKFFALDDGSERRLAVDVNFYPPVPQVKLLDWDRYQGKVIVDWRCIPLPIRFKPNGSRLDNLNKIRILVTMGATDPLDITKNIIPYFSPFANEVGFIFVVSESKKSLISKLCGSHLIDFEVLTNVKDMASVMKRCNLAVASFGTVAYELAACGVPSLLISLTRDHFASSQIFAESKLGLSLGVWGEFSLTDNFQPVLSNLLYQPNLLRDMRAKLSKFPPGDDGRFLVENIINVCR